MGRKVFLRGATFNFSCYLIRGKSLSDDIQSVSAACYLSLVASDLINLRYSKLHTFCPDAPLWKMAHFELLKSIILIQCNPHTATSWQLSSSIYKGRPLNASGTRKFDLRLLVLRLDVQASPCRMMCVQSLIQDGFFFFSKFWLFSQTSDLNLRSLTFFLRIKVRGKKISPMNKVRFPRFKSDLTFEINSIWMKGSLINLIMSHTNKVFLVLKMHWLLFSSLTFKVLT